MFGWLSGKKYYTKKELQRWAEKRIKKGVPRQQICSEINKMFENSSPKLTIDCIGNKRIVK